MATREVDDVLSSRRALSHAAKNLNKALYTISPELLPEPLRTLRVTYDNAQQYLNAVEKSCRHS